MTKGWIFILNKIQLFLINYMPDILTNDNGVQTDYYADTSQKQISIKSIKNADTNQASTIFHFQKIATI